MPRNSSQLTPAWLVAGSFGAASEVWMYRQAALMRRIDLTVYAYAYQHPDQFPPTNFQVRLIEQGPQLPKSKLARQLTLNARGFRNWDHGGFRGSRHQLLWWKDQLQQTPPQVALAHYGTMAVEIYPLLHSFGIPLVAHFNGYDLSSALRTSIYRWRLSRLASRFAACVVVADYMRDCLLELGVAADRIHKIPYGFPQDQLNPSTAVGDSLCRVLAVGRFVPKKRPDLTVRAFALAAQQVADMQLVMVGDGPMLKECKELAEKLGVTNQVEFLGSQPPDRVAAELGRASMFVQHSVTADSGDKEGWPVAIAEAAGSGLPVVATRHASIPEQIEHGVGGLLCEEGDWKSMGANLLTLAKDRDLRVEMGKAARNHMQQFDTAGQVAQLEQLLLDISNSQP